MAYPFRLQKNVDVYSPLLLSVRRIFSFLQLKEPSTAKNNQTLCLCVWGHKSRCSECDHLWKWGNTQPHLSRKHSFSRRRHSKQDQAVSLLDCFHWLENRTSCVFLWCINPTSFEGFSLLYCTQDHSPYRTNFWRFCTPRWPWHQWAAGQLIMDISVVMQVCSATFFFYLPCIWYPVLFEEGAYGNALVGHTLWEKDCTQFYTIYHIAL